LKKGEWTFITNHARLLAYLTKNPRATVQTIAFNSGLSIRAVIKIINDLRDGGYLSYQKIGRCNRYTVHLAQPMLRSLEKGYPVEDLLAAVGCRSHENASNAPVTGAKSDV
jgi:DNA-binding Lrp family transcriptional regulator